MKRNTNFVASSFITLALVGTTDNLTVSPPIANIGCDANGDNPRFENQMFRAELTQDEVITTLYVDGKRSGTISLNIGEIKIYDKVGYIEFEIIKLKTNDLNQTLTIPFQIKQDDEFKLYKNYNLQITLNKDGQNGSNGSDGSNGDDGNDGAGINEIIKYYQTTQLFNAPNKDNLFEWDTNIEEPTELKPYVWMFERTTYTMNKPYSDTNVILFKNYVANGKEMVFQGQYEHDKKYYVNHPYINVVRMGEPNNYFFKRSKNYHTLTTNNAVLLQDDGGIYFINQYPSEDNSKYWDDFSNNFQSVATNLLFAEEAFIGDLDTNGITIGDRSNGAVGWKLSEESIKSRTLSGNSPKYMLDKNGNTILQKNDKTKVFLGNLDESDTGKSGYGLYAENAYLTGQFTLGSTGETIENAIGNSNSTNLLTYSLIGQDLPANYTISTQNDVQTTEYQDSGMKFITNQLAHVNSGKMISVDMQDLGLIHGDTVTFSVDVKGISASTSIQLYFCRSTDSGKEVWRDMQLLKTQKLTRNYTRLHGTYKIPEKDVFNSESQYRIGFLLKSGPSSNIIFTRIKLEKGDKVTKWERSKYDTPLSSKPGFNILKKSERIQGTSNNTWHFLYPVVQKFEQGNDYYCMSFKNNSNKTLRINIKFDDQHEYRTATASPMETVQYASKIPLNTLFHGSFNLVLNSIDDDPIGTFDLQDLKLEYGAIPTPWCESTEDAKFNGLNLYNHNTEVQFTNCINHRKFIGGMEFKLNKVSESEVHIPFVRMNNILKNDREHSIQFKHKLSPDSLISESNFQIKYPENQLGKEFTSVKSKEQFFKMTIIPNRYDPTHDFIDIVAHNPNIDTGQIIITDLQVEQGPYVSNYGLSPIDTQAAILFSQDQIELKLGQTGINIEKGEVNIAAENFKIGRYVDNEFKGGAAFITSVNDDNTITTRLNIDALETDNLTVNKLETVADNGTSKVVIDQASVNVYNMSQMMGININTEEPTTLSNIIGGAENMVEWNNYFSWQAYNLDYGKKTYTLGRPSNTNVLWEPIDLNSYSKVIEFKIHEQGGSMSIPRLKFKLKGVIRYTNISYHSLLKCKYTVKHTVYDIKTGGLITTNIIKSDLLQLKESWLPTLDPDDRLTINLLPKPDPLLTEAVINIPTITQIGRHIIEMNFETSYSLNAQQDSIDMQGTISVNPKIEFFDPESNPVPKESKQISKWNNTSFCIMRDSDHYVALSNINDNDVRVINVRDDDGLGNVYELPLVASGYYNNSGYRKWSDGYAECWVRIKKGTASTSENHEVTLPISFKDVNSMYPTVSYSGGDSMTTSSVKYWQYKIISNNTIKIIIYNNALTTIKVTGIWK